MSQRGKKKYSKSNCKQRTVPSRCGPYRRLSNESHRD